MTFYFLLVSNLPLQHRREYADRHMKCKTMYQAEKLENITQEATRLKVDILGLTDVRWLKSGNFQCDSHISI